MGKTEPSASTGDAQRNSAFNGWAGAASRLRARLGPPYRRFADAARQCLSNRWLPDLAALVSWQADSFDRRESRGLTATLVVLGVLGQAAVGWGLPEVSAKSAVWGLILTPFYSGLHLAAAVWICRLYGVIAHWRGAVVHREITYTGLLMLLTACAEIVFLAPEALREVGHQLIVPLAILLSVYVKGILFMRFLANSASAPEAMRTRIATWGSALLVGLTMMATLLFTTVSALFATP